MPAVGTPSVAGTAAWVGEARDERGRWTADGHGTTFPVGEHAILTAENPGGSKISAVLNRQRNAELRRHLEGKGYHVTPVMGEYTDPETGQALTEHSYLVNGMPPGEAVSVAKRFGQHGVITRAGYHDLVHGQLAPTAGYVAVGKPPFTELPGGMRMRSKIDWANPVPDQHYPQMVSSVEANRWMTHPHVAKARSMHYRFGWE